MVTKARSVFVQGPGAPAYRLMFVRYGFVGADTIQAADIVCFTGGEDVDPSLYNERPHFKTGFNRARDELDTLAYWEAKFLNKFMIGICRGAQFLNVMNGGKLWQHVVGHATGMTHEATDLATGEVLNVTSTHHQMMRPADSAKVLMIATCATSKFAQDDNWFKHRDPGQVDIESVWYPETRSLCYQPHPEYQGHPECTDKFFDYLDDHYDIKTEAQKVA